MWTLQTERSVIAVGIVCCLAGVFCLVAGVCAWRAELQFQAVAVETVATIASADGQWKGLRFDADKGPVEVRARVRGLHDAVGSQLRIYYVPGDPQSWRRGPRPNPSDELIVAGVGVGFEVAGVVLLGLGWLARRWSGRPFWL